MVDFNIATLADVEEIEKVSFEERLPYFNTYEMLKKGAAIDPDAVAMSFILNGDNYADPLQVTYRELIEQITRTANLFHDL
ncbi:MAG: acyl-CoA synthetase, partial [Deltaproteobacteria bacterium]|nr:acyl-CoA synthetase [Deltaproteobacteria bacterium]